MGKTQIALEYAYRHGLDYRAVFWIAEQTSEQIVASLLHIAEVLQVPERTDTERSALLANGTLSIRIGATFALDQAVEAHRLAESRTVTGKSVLIL